VFAGSNNAASAAERALAITSQPDLGVTALFCATDRVALWAMHALIRRGVRVPEDISIGGVDDVPEGMMVNPPLTTISQSFRDMGDCAVRLLLELIDTPGQPPRSIIHPAKLVVRESVAEIES
jgi:DNA-binding LacI/PurR family transcriptional regulator